MIFHLKKNYENGEIDCNSQEHRQNLRNLFIASYMEDWIPTWSTLPEASKACNELIKCGCRSGCRRHLQVQQGKSALHGNVYVFLQWQLLSRVKTG